MENGSYRFEKFSFRIIDAPREVIDYVHETFDKSMIKSGHYYKDSNVKILSIEIKDGVDYAGFISAVKNFKVERRKCGIFASLVTDRDTSGLAVPDFVIDIYFEIGYTLDFSFTVV